MEDAMMYGWWDGSSVPWYGMIFGPVMMILFATLTVLIIAWALRAVGLGWQSSPSSDSPLDILKRRFAQGEIDRAEYGEAKKLLEP
jgi:putative membrane protein